MVCAVLLNMLPRGITGGKRRSKLIDTSEDTCIRGKREENQRAKLVFGSTLNKIKKQAFLKGIHVTHYLLCQNSKRCGHFRQTLKITLLATKLVL